MSSLSLLPYKNSIVSQWYPDQNYSTSPALFAGRYLQSGDVYRSLMQFDLSVISSGSTIETASLILNMYRNETGPTGAYVRVFHLLNDWIEASLTWNSQPPYSQTPFSPVWDGSVYVSGTTPPGPVAIDISGLVRGWQEGFIPNNGLLLAGNETANSLVGFRSTKYMFSDSWPMLGITYVNGSLDICDTQILTIPSAPEHPIVASDFVPLGARQEVTFMVENNSTSIHVRVMLQVGNESEFFSASPWHTLDPKGTPGASLAISTSYAAEAARVLFQGAGGETLTVMPRCKN